jgi:hypothetical protein
MWGLAAVSLDKTLTIAEYYWVFGGFSMFFRRGLKPAYPGIWPVFFNDPGNRPA